ncbi:MAG: BatD family protein [Myxococcota bacterium]
MKTIAGLTSWLFVVLAIGMLAEPAAAAEYNLDVKVQPRVVEVGETFQYEINADIAGNDRIRVAQRPSFPPELRVAGTSNSPRFVLRNGRAQRSLTTVYRVRAMEVGTFEIDGPAVQIGQKTVKGESLSVEVVARDDAPPSRNSSAKKDEKLFVDYIIEPSRKPYVGEQITLAFYIFTASMGVSTAPQPPNEPSLDEFWIEDLSQKVAGRRETVQVGGKFMHRTGLRAYALFPLRAGTTTIDPLSVDVRVGGFMSNRRMMEVASDPIELDVQPLPPDPPDSFYDGNVGKWEFRVTTDRMTAKAGEPVRIRVTAEGAGHVSRIQLPPLPDIEKARLAGSDEKIDRRVKQMSVRGEKTMEYTLVPTETGSLEIPALAFSYFDPDLQKYRTEMSQPLRLTVEPGGEDLEAQPAPAPEPETRDEDKSVMETLIAKMRPPTNRLEAEEQQPDLLESPLYWVVVGIPLLGLIFLVSTPYVQRWRSRETPTKTRKKAARKARHLLDEARTASADDMLEYVHKALETYLVEALSIKRTELSEQALPGALADRGAPDSVCKRAGDVIAAVNTQRYAPGASTDKAEVDRLADEVARLIDRLERGRASGDISAVAAAIVGAICLAGTLALPVPVAAQPDGSDQSQPDSAALGDVLDDIQRAQADGQWLEAAKTWSTLAESRPGNAEVQYNLGTALAQSGRFGRARLALERAALLAPQRADIGQNRELVERIVRLRQIEEARGTVRENTTSEGLFWWRLAGQTPEHTFPLAIAIFLWVALILAGLERVRDVDGPRWERWAAILAFCLALVAAAGWTARHAVLDSIDPVVVVAEEPRLREGPSKHAASQRVSTVLVPGVMLPVTQARDGWVELEFADGSRAWLARSDVEYVEPHPSDS